MDPAIEKLEKEIEYNESTCNAIEDAKKIKKYKKLLSKYKEEVEWLTESNTKIRRRCQDAINIKDQVVHWQRKFKDCERKMQKMEDEVKAKREEWMSKDDELKQLREENVVLQAKTKKKGNKKELKSANEEISKLRKENEKLSTQYFDKAKMIRFLYEKVEKVDAIANAYTKSREENKELEEKIKKMKYRLRKVYKELKQVREEQEIIESTKVEMKELILKNDEKDEQIQMLNAKIEDLQFINDELNVKCQRVDETNVKTTTTVDHKDIMVSEGLLGNREEEKVECIETKKLDVVKVGSEKYHKKFVIDDKKNVLMEKAVTAIKERLRKTINEGHQKQGNFLLSTKLI